MQKRLRFWVGVAALAVLCGCAQQRGDAGADRQPGFYGGVVGGVSRP